MNLKESVWPNEELQHWINVSKLHQTHYSKPFVIPPLPPLAMPHTPSKCAVSQLKTPSTASTIITPSTVCSTVSSIHNASTSPPRLRHPARLRSKDHQALIFKLYLNHFIHFASQLSSTSSCHDDSGSEAEGEDDHFSFSRRHRNESPSKRLQRLHCNLNEETATPKASRMMLDATPKQSKPVKLKPQSVSSAHATQPEIRGFTLSYLRRVPELSHLAYAVVHKEVKTRAREARRRETEADRAGLTVVRGRPVGLRQGHELKESTGRKVKRLFGWAVRELRYEGAVIVQDADAAVWRGPPSRGIWKPIEANASLDKTALSAGDAFSSSATVTSFDISNGLDEDQGELSDPSPNEESYIPLTSSLLYVPIEKAIQALCERKKRQLLKERQSLSGPASRAVQNFNAPPGPTAEEIRKYLQQVDDRWMYVGEYVVKDALKELCAPGVERLQKMGDRWKLTLGRYVT